MAGKKGVPVITVLDELVEQQLHRDGLSPDAIVHDILTGGPPALKKYSRWTVYSLYMSGRLKKAGPVLSRAIEAVCDSCRESL